MFFAERRRRLSLLAFFALAPSLSAEPLEPAAAPPGYKEAPYYLRKLAETDQEGKRYEFNKLIHDAIVNADVSDRTTARRMAPIVDKVRAAIQAGLDRPYLEGRSMWLGSAVAFYDREKDRRLVSCPPSEWYGEQSRSRTGAAIASFPDKILLLQGDANMTLVEESGLLESVISADGRRVAFAKTAGEKTEVWTIDTRNGRKRRIGTFESVRTILFSLDGDRVFVQERGERNNEESAVFRVGAKGGRAKPIGRVRLLKSVVEKGRHRGRIVAEKDRPHHLGLTPLRCAYVIREDGREIGRIREIPCE